MADESDYRISSRQKSTALRHRDIRDRNFDGMGAFHLIADSDDDAARRVPFCRLGAGRAAGLGTEGSHLVLPCMAVYSIC